MGFLTGRSQALTYTKSGFRGDQNTNDFNPFIMFTDQIRAVNKQGHQIDEQTIEPATTELQKTGNNIFGILAGIPLAPFGIQNVPKQFGEIGIGLGNEIGRTVDQTGHFFVDATADGIDQGGQMLGGLMNLPGTAIK